MANWQARTAKQHCPTEIPREALAVFGSAGFLAFVPVRKYLQAVECRFWMKGSIINTFMQSVIYPHHFLSSPHMLSSFQLKFYSEWLQLNWHSAVVIDTLLCQWQDNKDLFSLFFPFLPLDQADTSRLTRSSVTEIEITFRQPSFNDRVQPTKDDDSSLKEKDTY